MDADKMLRILAEHGEDAGGDYNDGDEVMGYFGWTVNGRRLVITFEPDDGEKTTVAFLLAEERKS